MQAIKPTKDDGAEARRVTIRAGRDGLGLYASNGARRFVLLSMPADVEGESFVDVATGELASAVKAFPSKGEATFSVASDLLILGVTGAEDVTIPALVSAHAVPDDLVAQAIVEAVVPASVLLDALNVGHAFTRTREHWREEHLNVVLIRDGVLTAMDGRSLLRAEVPWALSWRMVLHRKDSVGIRAFLRLHRGGDVELLCHERCFMIRGRSGFIYGVTHYPGHYPSVAAPRYKGQGWCVLDAKRALAAVGALWDSAPKPAKATLLLAVDADSEKLVLWRGSSVERVVLDDLGGGLEWMDGKQLELPLERFKQMLKHSPSSTRITFGYTERKVLCGTKFSLAGTSFQVLIPGELTDAL